MAFGTFGVWDACQLADRGVCGERSKSDDLDVVVVASEFSFLFSRERVPDSDGLVFGAASNEFAIGRRGDASDPF